MVIYQIFPKSCEKVGRKRVQLELEDMKDIFFHRRTNLRSLSSVLNVLTSTLHGRIKAVYIQPHSNSMRPELIDDNKKARLEFCLSMIGEGTYATKHFFVNMRNQIDIDEKWFYMT